MKRQTKSRSLRRLVSQRRVILSLAALIFIAISVVPVLQMFAASFAAPEGGFSLSNYGRLFLDQRQRALLLNSILLGGGTSLVATMIGAPLGLLLARSDLPAKRLLRLALVVPLALPSYILGLAWMYIGGSAGLLAQLTGHDLLSNWTYSLAGAVTVLALNFFPLSMLATEAAAKRVEAHLEEAALLIAPLRRVLWQITTPLVAPGVAAAALIIFVLAISEFAVPSLLRVPVFTTEVFTAFASLYDFGAATALALPLLIVALVAGVGVRLIVGSHAISTRRGSQNALRLSLGRLRTLTIAAFLCVLLVSLGLPVGILARETGSAAAMVLAIHNSRGAIANSIALSSVGAVLIVLLASLLAYAVARARPKLHAVAEVALLVTFAVPSTVVGVGLIELWNRPGPAEAVYRSLAVIVIAYLARITPVATLILAANFRQVSPSLEEAAAVAGAGWFRTFTRVVLPQIKPGLVATLLVSFIFAFGELGATVLVAPPGSATLPVHIYTMIANAPPSNVAALALMQIMILAVPLSLLGLAGYRRKGA